MPPTLATFAPAISLLLAIRPDGPSVFVPLIGYRLFGYRCYGDPPDKQIQQLPRWFVRRLSKGGDLRKMSLVVSLFAPSILAMYASPRVIFLPMDPMAGRTPVGSIPGPAV
jgi:hypothetical protein